MTDQAQPRTVSVDHAARLLGCSRRTIFYRIKAGVLKTIQFPNRSRRILVTSLEKLIDAENAERANR